MAKFTPGPWEIIVTEYKRGRRIEVCRKGLSEPIAHIQHKGICNGYRYTLPVEANAQLIHATPDLFNACRVVRWYLDEPNSITLERAKELLDEAIDKAIGGGVICGVSYMPSCPACGHPLMTGDGEETLPVSERSR